MDERLQFVARRLAGEPMSELCQEFGISRKTGYKIFDRYQDYGVQGLTDRSRRPHHYAATGEPDLRTNSDGESLRELLAKHHLLQPLEVDRLCDAGHSSKSGVVAGLIAHSSVAVLCGDSGLGKSPLAYQLGLSVAAGVPFAEMKTEPGLVVYADFENSLEQSREVREQLIQFLDLSKAPSNFVLWTPDSGYSLELEGICRDVRPTLLIIDSLRSYSPHFEKSDYAGEAMKSLNELARRHATSILVIHHIRKPGENGAPLLDNEDTGLMLWLKQTAGHSSIINQSHARIAADLPDKRKSHSEDTALVLRWHRRIYGEDGPLYLERVCDGNGDPVGYRRLANIELLGNVDQEAAFRNLPSEFTFKQAKEVFGRSDDPTRKWLQKCGWLGLVCQTGRGRYARSDARVAEIHRVDRGKEDGQPVTPTDHYM
jgi:hypothetical protein